MPVVTTRYESMQYDGTNGADLIEWLCGTVHLISDDGSELVVDFAGSERRIPTGGWAIAGGGGAGFRAFSTEMTDADYVNYWREAAV